jgi:Collagen triple helix repeat (20 copies)
MFSPLRNRFGIPGVISVIALVFAMFGGAYAASNNSGGGKATASAKGKPGPPGPRGKTGKTGPAGPAGPQGPAGANGAKGDTGAPGSNGTNGSNGASVTNTVVPTSSATCGHLGGAEFKVGSGAPTTACNGKEGEEGEEGPQGEPWTAGGTLPPGATETGSWAFDVNEAGVEVLEPISFPIKLSALISEAHVHYGIEEPAFHSICSGTILNPTAPPGELCVYQSPVEFLGADLKGVFPLGSEGDEGAARVGATLAFVTTAAPGYGIGSWAVTGCTTTVGEPAQCP